MEGFLRPKGKNDSEVKLMRTKFQEKHMKKAGVLLAAVMVIAMFVMVGCEWSSGGGKNGFNTSRGAGVSVNFGGVYHGTFSGGKAVERTSGGAITRLVIMHGGNAVRATDNNGSEYEGTVGSPGAVSSAQDGTYPVGAELVTAQVTFAGKDKTTGREIEFVGVFHAVAIEDIKGSSSESSYTRDEQLTWSTNVTSGTDVTNIVTTITIIAYNAAGQEVFRSVETTTRTPAGIVVEHNHVVTDNRSYTETETMTYTLTEANSQFKLEGTWMEKDAVISGFSALSSGSSGIISVGTADAGD